MQHKAVIKIDRSFLSLIYRSEGHAGDAASGQNIICSAASILAFTLANKVSCALKCGWLDEKNVRIKLDADGSVIACIANDEEVFGELARDFMFVGTGYCMLMQSYPEEVEYREAITA